MAPSSALTYTILVAVDYSALAALAVQAALKVAHERSATDLHLVHVAKGAVEADSAAEEQRKSELLNWISTQLKEQQSLPRHVVGHLASGDPATQIVQLAADLNADMVVVGTHGRTGLGRAVLGSVAENVVRHAGCQVLVIRDKHHAQPAPHIEAACARCVEAREKSAGSVLWCEQHLERHGRRHTYFSPGARSWPSSRLIF